MLIIMYSTNLLVFSKIEKLFINSIKTSFIKRIGVAKSQLLGKSFRLIWIIHQWVLETFFIIALFCLFMHYWIKYVVYQATESANCANSGSHLRSLPELQRAGASLEPKAQRLNDEREELRWIWINQKSGIKK